MSKQEQDRIRKTERLLKSEANCAGRLRRASKTATLRTYHEGRQQAFLEAISILRGYQEEDEDEE